MSEKYRNFARILDYISHNHHFHRDAMTNKEEYRQFCKDTPLLPIFLQDWWLDAVCAGKQWDVLLIKDEQGRILAATPYLLRKRAWTRYIIMPQMTQIAGPWLTPLAQQDASYALDVCDNLAQQLSALDIAYYYQHYAIDSPVVPHMEMLGFKVKERTTYRIEDLSNLDGVIESFSKNKKRQLQKALSLHADHALHVEDFYRFHTACLLERGKQISYSREFLLVLERKTKRLEQSAIIGIRNADDMLLAAAFVVWDKTSLYYLIPCYSEAHKKSGASALLVLECIKLARQLGVAFDFEGSMVSGIANHYKQFGSTATTYYSVEKYYKWWFRLAIFWNWIKGRKMR